ncbi:DMT family transporter [Desulfocurvus sp. DL9XJH121]
MSVLVMTVVLCAALLHATWNFFVKNTADKHVSMTAVVLGHTPFAVAALCVSPLPDIRSLPYIVAGAALHVGYQIFLLNSYRLGDLSQVYPLARGSAPLIVAGVSTVLLGVHLSTPEIAAVVVIGVGIMSLALVRRSDGLRNGRATVLSLGTGMFIASYSLVDGMGAREAGTALGFYGCLAVLDSVFLAALMRVLHPGIVTRVLRHEWSMALRGGGASFTAYALVTWAFTMAPISLVAALRETSIIFALVLGVFVLKERLDIMKVFATACTLLGVGLLRLNR